MRLTNFSPLQTTFSHFLDGCGRRNRPSAREIMQINRLLLGTQIISVALVILDWRLLSPIVILKLCVQARSVVWIFLIRCKCNKVSEAYWRVIGVRRSRDGELLESPGGGCGAETPCSTWRRLGRGSLRRAARAEWFSSRGPHGDGSTQHPATLPYIAESDAPCSSAGMNAHAPRERPRYKHNRLGLP